MGFANGVNSLAIGKEAAADGGAVFGGRRRNRAYEAWLGLWVVEYWVASWGFVFIAEIFRISSSEFLYMGEDLIEMMKKFDLSEKEASGVTLDFKDVEDGLKGCKKSLIRKIIGKKMVNKTGIRNFALSTWRRLKLFQVVELGIAFFSFFLRKNLTFKEYYQRGLT
ncbi:hypothetical protein ACH5RR_023320 [Cinchona calisaya]|uniref:Uncharacterized protein n=1 Tax=Cinchona calisaya TaxID=153742 RepID=A0ABD2ZAD9_9GENT